LKITKSIIYQSPFFLDDDDDNDDIDVDEFYIGLLDHPGFCFHGVLRNELNVWLENIVLSRISETKQRELAAWGGAVKESMVFPCVA